METMIKTISLILLSLTAIVSLATPQVEDELKSHCSTTHSLTFSKGIYTTNATIKSEHGKPHAFKFLFDTGYSHSSLGPKACKAIGCKVIGREKLNPINNIEVSKTTPVIVSLGAKEFGLAKMDLDESSTLSTVGVDGVIGGDIIFKDQLIVNLKSSYLCFTSTPVYQLAEQFQLQKVDAVYDAGRVWLGFYANGKKIDDYFLDTGSDTTSLIPKDIEELKLAEVGEEVRNASEHGLQTVKAYGPLSIKFAGYTMGLKSVTSPSDPQMRKLGTDVLKSYILGFDRETKFAFIGH